MKKNPFSSLLFCMLTGLFMLMMVSVKGQGDTAWTAKKASKWVKSRAWAHGLTLKVHPSVNDMEFARQYAKDSAKWNKAFGFLRDHNLDQLAPGKYPIDGDEVFANVTESATKDMEKTGWESHRKYIDLQYVISGKEKIGVAPVAKAEVIKEYDPAKDVANYKTDGKFYVAEPGTFFLYFPTETHRPSVKVDGIDKNKKIVIKISYK